MMAAALPALPLLLVTACGPEPTSQFDDALQAYEAKRYGESLRLATEAQSASVEMPQRQKAALVAGMSAYQLNRFDDARASLAIAARSADPVTAGRAMAMQGAIAVEQKRWGEAERAYNQAAEKLTGAEAAKARERARDARALAESAGRPAAVAKSGGSGSAQAKPPVAPGSAMPLSSAPDAGNWTVIAGTFSSETAARQRATGLADDAKRAGLGVPRVVPTGSTGRKLWLVEVGTFDSRAKADAARKKVPVADAAVAPSQGRAARRVNRPS